MPQTISYFRPKLNRQINALSYADKRGQGVYYNALGASKKRHRKQVDLILPREVTKPNMRSARM